MGQQQLLLLILSAVIVGVAIVMGINMFGENATQANQDAVLQDVLTLATRAQAWYRRPTQLGGGGRDYTSVSLTTLNFASPNSNGSYAITGSGNTATITGTGLEDGDDDGTMIQIQVTVGADTVGAASITD